MVRRSGRAFRLHVLFDDCGLPCLSRHAPPILELRCAHGSPLPLPRHDRACRACYLGYKAITVAEKRLRIRDAAERRSRHHTDSARRLYELAIRRQGLLIKFGQIVGSRPDLIPDEYIAVLSRLQDQVPPRPFAVIKRRIERQLERPLADVFASFDEKPIAAASLAQVHRATLHDGREVAVKVQYPGIQSIVDNDLRNIRFLMRILARFERNLDFSPLIEEVSHNVPWSWTSSMKGTMRR